MIIVHGFEDYELTPNEFKEMISGNLPDSQLCCEATVDGVKKSIGEWQNNPPSSNETITIEVPVELVLKVCKGIETMHEIFDIFDIVKSKVKEQSNV